MEGVSMAKYLLKMRSTVDAPASAGNLISEEDQILHILAVRRSKYDAFVIFITMWTKPLHLPDLCAMLLAHACRLDQATSAIPETMSINLSQRKECIPKKYSPDTPIDLNWYLDPEATNHYSSSPTIFSNKQEITGCEKIYMGNEEGLKFSHAGNSYFPINSSNSHMYILNCIHIFVLLRTGLLEQLFYKASLKKDFISLQQIKLNQIQIPMDLPRSI